LGLLLLLFYPVNKCYVYNNMPPKKPAASAKKKPAANKKPKVQYTFEKVDNDGDGVPDGDIVTKYVDGVISERKYIPLKMLKAQLKKEVAKAKPAKKRAATAAAPQVAQAQQAPTIYSDAPSVQQTNSPVIISDQTSFGQFVKQGAGTALGSIATNTVVSAIGSFFNGEE
jgi:hypothetical protein